MDISEEFKELTILLIATALFTAFLYEAPWYFTTLMITPLAMAFWFWPHGSTILAYLVGALLGTLLTTMDFLREIQGPAEISPLVWLPLVWGPAGVMIKRLEMVVEELVKRRRRRT